MKLIECHDDIVLKQPQLNWPRVYYTDCNKYKVIVSYLEKAKSSPRFVTIAHHPNICKLVSDDLCSYLLAEVGLVSANDITALMEQLFPGEMNPGVRRFMENM